MKKEIPFTDELTCPICREGMVVLWDAQEDKNEYECRIESCEYSFAIHKINYIGDRKNRKNL